MIISAMGVVHRRNYHRRRLLTAIATMFALLLHASAIKLGRIAAEEREETKREIWSGDLERVLTRRRLVGPGSSPPTCRSKCGRCWPCKPVHVPIQPGVTLPLEYYPEAWRCKCGNKLYMP